ncbi:hypothetical protein BGX38DRAFT_1146567 [Terfezia claveryi]|nr:hypothetical protein BGX38DRAFT_1146567 [Terfezia claveryi]
MNDPPQQNNLRCHGIAYFSERQSYNYGRFFQFIITQNPQIPKDKCPGLYEECLKHFSTSKDAKFRTQREFAIQELKRAKADTTPIETEIDTEADTEDESFRTTESQFTEQRLSNVECSTLRLEQTVKSLYQEIARLQTELLHLRGRVTSARNSCDRRASRGQHISLASSTRVQKSVKKVTKSV